MPRCSTVVYSDIFLFFLSFRTRQGALLLVSSYDSDQVAAVFLETEKVAALAAHRRGTLLPPGGRKMRRDASGAVAKRREMPYRAPPPLPHELDRGSSENELL